MTEEISANPQQTIDYRALTNNDEAALRDFYINVGQGVRNRKNHTHLLEMPPNEGDDFVRKALDPEESYILTAFLDGDIVGIAQYLYLNGEKDSAEFNYFVRKDMRGVGFILTSKILAYAQQHGLSSLVGVIDRNDYRASRTLTKIASILGLSNHFEGSVGAREVYIDLQKS